MPTLVKWLLPWALIAQVHASEFPVAIGNTAYNNMPGLAERIVSALQDQGLDAELQVMPGNRALNLLQQGGVALDIIRHSDVVKHHAQLRQIKPAVIHLNWSRITSSAAQENCTKAGEQLAVIGIKGIPAFEGVIIPKFKSIVWAPSEESALRMTSAQRKDVTYWMKSRLDLVHTNYADTLTICSENEISIPLHSYLNDEFEWALPKVEAAYINLFSKSNK
ncbi:MAG: hypothetical protein ACRBBW_02185 [Cellvibrionaceae bacterium]